jgi:hypothetical protein
MCHPSSDYWLSPLFSPIEANEALVQLQNFSKLGSIFRVNFPLSTLD